MLRVLICLVTLTVLPTAAFSAEIKKINEKASAILIDEGEETGFAKGKKVCIYDGEKKVACGKVAKAAKKKSFVRVSKKKIDKLKTGFMVSLAEDSMNEPKKDIVTGPPKSPYSMSLALQIHLMPMTPATWDQLEYVPSAPGNTSYWQSNGTTSSIFVPPGFGLEFEMLHWGLIAGFRFGSFAPSSVDNTTNAFTNANLSMNTNITGTDIGFWLDYVYFKKWNINFAAGLDIDMTSLTMNATQTDATGAIADVDAYDATSSLTTMSLRLPIVYKLAFGRFGISAGLDLMLPLFAMGPTQAVTTAPDASGSDGATSTVGLRGKSLGLQGAAPIVPDAGDDATDLLTAMNHKKGGIAADIVIGLFFQF